MLANDLAFIDLFAQRSPFQVPKYQRSYAWGDEELKDFVRDLEQTFLARQTANPKKHFFGGIVCLHYPAQNTLGRKYEVIDGQQRLATFGVFFARLRYWNTVLVGECHQAGDPDGAKLAEARADRIRTSLLEYQDEIDGKPVQQQRIVLSKADKEFFTALIAGTPLTPQRESHNLLLRANEALDAFIKRLVDAAPDSKAKLAALDTLAKAATEDCHVVHLVSETKTEAYRLFEVLNDRGRSLSEGDLLRSTTLERLEGAASLQDQAEKIWDQILAAKAGHIDKFLRTYYASRLGKRAGHRSLFDDFLREIFPSAQSHAAVLKTLKDMQSAYTLFNCLAEGDWPYEPSTVAVWDRNRLKLLSQVLKNELCFPLLLAACQLPEKPFAAIVHLVEFAVFRHIHCSRQHPSRLDSVFLLQAVEIRKKPAAYKPTTLRSALKTTLDTYSADAVFREGMRSELVYRDKAGNSVTKYFLTTIEQFRSWYANGAKGNPTCKDKTAVYDLSQIEIEHIYPRNSASPDPLMEPLKQHLGNLSFWGPNDNTKAANQTFAAKKKLYALSNVQLNQDVAKLPKFEVPELDSREIDLVTRGLAIFRM
jgi:Protein of unknown function DUF262/Protein of unknown function (DUF1524)